MVLPPLPSKQRLDYLDRFSDEFISRRQFALERYINLVLAHPSLYASPMVKKFLEEEFWTPEAYVGASMAAAEKEGLIDSVSDKLLNAFTKVKKPDPRFIDVQQQSIIYEDNIATIEKYAHRLITAYTDLSTDLHTFSLAMAEVAAQETVHGASLGHFSQSCEADSKLVKELMQAEDQMLMGFLHEQLGYCKSVKDTLKARDAKQMDFEGLTEYLGQQQQEYERLQNPNSRGSSGNLTQMLRGKLDELKGGDPEQLRQQRLMKLEQKIAELRKAVEQSNEVNVKFSEEVVRELQRYQTTKEREIKAMLQCTARNNLQYFRSGAKTYEQLIRMLQPQGTQ